MTPLGDPVDPEVYCRKASWSGAGKSPFRRVARPGFESIDFRCGLFYEQQLGSASFDLVTMWHFLEHDYDPLRSLREAARVLTSDGVLIIEVPRLDSLTFNLYEDRWPGLRRG